MWPGLTAEDRRFWRNVAEFARRSVLPRILEWDRAGTLPRSLWFDLAKQDFLGLAIPKTLGGAGAGVKRLALALDAFAYGSKDLGIVNSWGVHSAMAGMALVRFGTFEQQQKYLPLMASGTAVAAFALSEPEAGSHARAIKTTVRRDGDHYVVRGTKAHVSNAPFADLFVTIGRMESASDAFTALMIERDTSGLTVGLARDKSCIRTSPLANVQFDDCRIPLGACLGEEGMAFDAIVPSILDWDRCVVWAGRLGRLRTLLEDSVAYAARRVQFNKPIAQHQAIAFKLADMKVRLEAAQALLAQAVDNLERDELTNLSAALARLFLGEATMAGADDMAQIFGGNAFYPEFHVERYCRDSKLDGIGGGSSEIQHLIISRELLKITESVADPWLSDAVLP